MGTACDAGLFNVTPCGDESVAVSACVVPVRLLRRTMIHSGRWAHGSVESAKIRSMRSLRGRRFLAEPQAFNAGGAAGNVRRNQPKGQQFSAPARLV